MGRTFKTRWGAGFVALLCAAQLHATVFQVTVTTTPLSGTDATLAFDLISGGTPDNSSSVTIFEFAPDALLTSPSSGTAGVTGSLLDPAPATVTIAETEAFNEYLQPLTLGTSFTFSFFTTGTLPPSGSPDAFSFSLLDANLQPLVLTGDVNFPQTVFFSVDIGSAGVPQPLPILSPEGVTIEVTEAVTEAPEPAVALLLAGGLLAMAAVRRRASSTSR
jgi:hypothetical protein